MSSDDVLLDGRQIEITLGVFTRDARVMEAVELFEFDIVPVIKEVIVKKRASNELLLFKSEGKDHRQEKCRFGDGDTVVIAGAAAVLLKSFELVEMPGL